MNRPTYRAMAVLNAGPFQIARSSRPKTSAEAAIRGPGDPRRASRVSPAAPPIAPIACTPRSRPISPGPPCRRRATNRMNSTTKMPCAISATPATTSPTRTPIVTQRPQERARARARRRLVRRRGLAALCWMGFALGALSGRQARDQPRRGEEAHGVGGDDRAQIARGEQQATQRPAHQAGRPPGGPTRC